MLPLSKSYTLSLVSFYLDRNQQSKRFRYMGKSGQHFSHVAYIKKLKDAIFRHPSVILVITSATSQFINCDHRIDG